MTFKYTFTGIRCLAALGAVILNSLALGQTLGEITGVITDSSGAAMAEATVTVTNPETNFTRSVGSNAAGNYTLPALLPGVYSVRVEKPGFQPEIRSGVQLQVQQTARIDFQLRIGSMTEVVEVKGGAPLLATENATVGTVIENRRIVELPLNGRNYLSLIALSPNVTATYADGGSNAGAPSRQGGDRATQNFSVAGMRREFNYYTLDGVTNTDVNFNTYVFLPSIDALQEFKIQTGVYSAEFGREATQVNVSTKSGTNDYHGTLFDFLRNNALDARPYGFTRTVPVSAPFKWNQYGFTLGGPVQVPKLFNGRNRLFFMSNFEGFRLRRQTQQVFSTPPPGMRAGNFSQVLSATRITDILNGGQPFPGNIIPASRLSRPGLGLLEFYPAPNVAGTALVNNYLALQNRTNDKDQFTQRIDFVENSNSNWFGRYSWQSEFQLDPALWQNGKTLTVGVNQAMIANTRVLRPNLVNEFRFGYSGFHNSLANELQFKRNPIKELGLGVFNPAPAAWGTPGIGITGFSGFGDDVNGPYTINDHTFQWVDNMSWIRGTHTVKFGGEVRRDRFNQEGNQNARSSLAFQGQYAGYGFADYMLGYIRTIQNAAGLAIAQYRVTDYSLYVDDTWKLRPNLTLSVGLRYEYNPPWASRSDSTMNVWFPAGFGTVPGLRPCLVRVGSGDVYANTNVRFDPRICVARDGRLGDRLVKRDRNDFAPRVGLAWSPSAKTTIRAGFGLFYVFDTGNPRFDMARNLFGRIVNTSDAQNLLTFEKPFLVSSSVCGVPSPQFVCVTSPQGLGNEYNRRSSYVNQYLLNIQRQLDADTVLEVGYLGSQGHKLERIISQNLPAPAATGSVASRSPAPEFGNIQVMAPWANSNYHGGSVKLTRRSASGLTILAGYTFSKSIDSGSSIRTLGSDQLKPQDGLCLQCERGLSIFDTRHRLVSSLLYNLPAGRGKRFANRGVSAQVLGDWQLGAIWTVSSGFPLNIITGRDQSNTGHSYDRPNAVSGEKLKMASELRGSGQWFNIQAVSINPVGTYGSLGRTVAQGPGIFNVDFVALKNFKLGERLNLQFRFEAFNLPNHPNFGDPGTSLASNSLNAAGRPVAGTGSFGVINSTRGTINMRELQFGLKLSF